jgi:hypothetical protein
MVCFRFIVRSGFPKSTATIYADKTRKGEVHYFAHVGKYSGIVQIEKLFIVHDNAYAKVTWGSKGKPKNLDYPRGEMVFLDTTYSGCEYYNFSTDNSVNVSQPTVVSVNCLKDYVYFGQTDEGDMLLNNFFIC